MLVDTTGWAAPPPVPRQVPAAKTFGVACPTLAGQTPYAYLSGPMSIGSTTEWRLDLGELGVPVTLVISSTQTAEPLDVLGAPGCTLYAWPPLFSVTVTTDAEGEAVGLFPVPDLPGLIGVDYFGQWFVSDAVNPAGFVTSNGVALRMQP